MGQEMISLVLTQTMKRDLFECVRVYLRTLGTPDYPNGKATPLRRGRALERRGLVRNENANSANSTPVWSPTHDGLMWAGVRDMGDVIVPLRYGKMGR